MVSRAPSPDEAIQARFEHFQGPLPHPDHLREFEATLPGTADRLLRLTEVRSAHHCEMEIRQADWQDRALELTAQEKARTTYAGLLVTVLFLGVGTWFIATGGAVAGSVVLSVPIAEYVLSLVWRILRARARARGGIGIGIDTPPPAPNGRRTEPDPNNPA